ncbi:MAG: MFS transporter [Clostridia bacterium]|nr:MFS transporter [Clostridia bacterium]
MKKYLNFKEIAAYSLGLFGFQMIVGLLNSYQAEFYHEILGADLAAVGILILVVKVVSSAFDPIVGNRISRKGKIRPFILYAIIPFALTTVLVFIKVPFKGVLLYVWIFITFLLWSMSMTLGDVPSQGIASVITPNPQEKSDTISIANTFKEIGFSASAVIVPLICIIIPGGSKVFGFEGEKDTPISNSEYLGAAIAAAVLGCVLFFLIFKGTKERVPYHAQEMSLREMFATLKSNKYLMMVVLSYLLGACRKISMAIQVQAANVMLGSQNYVVLFGICMGLGSVVSMALIPVLLRRFDEKKVSVVVSVYGFIVSSAAVLIYNLLTQNIVVMFIMMFLSGLQFGVVNIVPMIMVADCVDYHEYETGKRIEGPAFSILTLTIKISLAISAAVGLIMLKVGNYSATTEIFTFFTKKVVFFTFVGLPGLASLISILPLRNYDLIGEKKKQIAAALQARREGNQEEI